MALVGFAAAARATEVPVTTVCDLMANPEAWSGKVVLLVGRQTSTNEGVWLDETCSQHVRTGRFSWQDLVHIIVRDDGEAPSKATPEVIRLAGVSTVRKAAKDVQARGVKPDVIAAVYGRVITKRLRVVNCGEKPCGLGFGHGGWAPVAIECVPDAVFVDLSKFLN